MTVNQDMPPRSAGRCPNRPGVRSHAAPQDTLEGEAASRQASVGRGNLRFPLRGLTLIELLVVLGIIGLILGISVPGLVGYASCLQLKTTARKLVTLVSLARSTAIGSHAEHAVVIDPEHREVKVINMESGEALETVIHLPTSIGIELMAGGEPVEETQFVFRPTGALLGRTISLVVSDRERQRTITVSGTTGAISIQ